MHIPPQLSSMGIPAQPAREDTRDAVIVVPEGASVNDAIDPRLCSLKYVTVDRKQCN